MKKSMNFIKNIISKLQEIKYSDILLIILISLMLTLSVFIIQPTPMAPTLSKLMSRPMVILLNFSPVFLLHLLLYSLSSRVGFSAKITSLAVLLLSLVNRTKIIYRDEPLGAFDLSLGVEAMTMSLKSKYTPDLNAVIFILLILIAEFLFFKIYKSKPVKWHKRVILSVLVIVASFTLYHQIYIKDWVYNSLEVDGLYYNDKDNYNSKGLLFCLIRNTSKIHIKVPENYQKSEFDDLKMSSLSSGKKLPNVVMIMGEAFDDLSELPIFETNESNDPIANFKMIQSQALATGRLVTPTFAGGTADTEFEVISGCMTDRVAPNKSYSYNGVNKDMNSIVRTFRNAGYYARGFHPGYGWFYKRQSVYPRLGFQESYFLDSVENAILKGGYLQEDQTYDEFIRRLDYDVKTKEEPVLDFMVTIQNHGPYYKGKYNEEFEIPTNKPISEELSQCLSSYFVGIHDMDLNLKRIYEYMKNSEEPFVFVFWGDHLPGLVGSTDYYNELDFKIGFESYEEELRFYSTPYVIWANDSARELLKLSEKSEMTISSHYLGALTLEMLGLDDIDPYYVFLNDLRTKLPVISRHYIYDGNQSYKKNDYAGEHLEDLEKYYRWQYYRITQKYQQ